MQPNHFSQNQLSNHLLPPDCITMAPSLSPVDILWSASKPRRSHASGARHSHIAQPSTAMPTSHPQHCAAKHCHSLANSLLSSVPSSRWEHRRYIAFSAPLAIKGQQELSISPPHHPGLSPTFSLLPPSPSSLFRRPHCKLRFSAAKPPHRRRHSGDYAMGKGK